MIKGGKRGDKYGTVARKEGETGGVDEVKVIVLMRVGGWRRGVRESVRRITSYLML